MADTKISALTAVTTPAGTDEFAVNQGGASKKMTLAQITAAALIPDPGASWAATTAYTVGQRVKDTGTLIGDSGVAVFECIVAGTSGAFNPFGWARTPVTDGTVTWAFIGAIGELDGRLISQPLVVTTGTNEIDVGTMGYAVGNGPVYAGPSAMTEGTGSANSGATAVANGPGSASAGATAVAIGNGGATTTHTAQVNGTGTAVAACIASYNAVSPTAYVQATATSAAANVQIHDGTDNGATGEFLGSDGAGNAVWATLISTGAGVPGGSFTTVFYFDTTAGTGGLYVWTGAAYTQVSDRSGAF